jgi:hypothetical protein
MNALLLPAQAAGWWRIVENVVLALARASIVTSSGG